MTSIPHIPILRAGRAHRSLDTQTVARVRDGQPAVELSLACPDMIKHDLLRSGAARQALRRFRCRDLVAICEKAAGIFLNDTLPVGCDGHMQSPEEYVRQLALTSGLPHRLIRMNMQRLHAAMSQTGTILKGLTRSLDLDVLDRGYGEQDGAPVSFSPATECLGVVLPSNSPAVNALWIPSVALKIPVVLKPGREEPWTPIRLIAALERAGAPPEAFSFYPAPHEGSGAIIRRCGRVMLFGGDDTVREYERDPRVEVHGTGYSKILIGEDEIENWERYVDTIVESVSANSGRSCINVSTIVVPRYGDEIARVVAEKLLTIRPLAQDDPEAKLSGFANPRMAEWINGAIDSGLKGGAWDVSAHLRRGEPRLQQRDGMVYLLPTIVRVPTWNHELAVREFLFPFASVVECPQEEVLVRMGKSLVVTAVTKNLTWVDQLFSHPAIERLNIGNIPTNHLKWDQPHEGNLFEFLYTRRSFQIEKLA